MKTFTYAGTARETDGSVVFRTTNRDGYAKILEKEGKTDINIMSLPHPMTKADAAAYIGFTDVKPAKAPVKATTKLAGITVKPAKATVVAADAEPAKTEAELEAIRAKNLETIQKVGRRYDQMAAKLAEMAD